MRVLLLCLTLAAIPLSQANAQSGWGMNTGMMGRFPSLGSMPVDAEWNRCANEDHKYSYEEALRSCDSILADADTDRWGEAGALWYRADLYFETGRHDAARADLQRAIERYNEIVEAEPREPYGYSNRASVNQRLENYDAALADYDRAIELENNFSSPHIGRGQILFRRGDYAGATAAFDRASRIAARSYGTTASIYANKCSARAAARTDLEAARRFCDRAVRNSDNDAAWVLSVRGYFHFLQAAARDFNRAIERDPLDANALYGRGVVAVRQGRQAEGEADMTRAREISTWRVDYYANAGLVP
jgi:tetratricopeptide (TPR) repeat protein